MFLQKLLLIALAAIDLSLSQTATIVFSGDGTSGQSENSTLQECTCVPRGTCPTGNNVGIDIRIVNQGGQCSAGLVFCCMQQSGSVTDGTCGIRKIELTPQPTGQASFGAYPWQAALLTTSNSYIGSGVLIDSNHVLTAAHKVAAYAGGSFKIRLGEWDGQVVSEMYPYQEYTPIRVFVHPNFNRQNLQNDVAVIRLNAAVPISTSPHINTACLPTTQVAAQTRCWVTGWGKNAFGPSGSYQSILREVDVPILSQSDCEVRLRSTRLGQFFSLDTNSFICAGGEPGKDACTGDGGAPLVCRHDNGSWHVHGMVAWGIGCANPGVPGVYVNVINFVSWINQQRNL
ncbi:trypsin [Orussus abietinus]|uniref:trypsin n=1 Tax=Orussus abietinus TaxID=222816 RepID=UPI000625C939|nr:trypsin [Orussus abietinus]